ncbi:MAG: Hpt domain-containing protein [Pseudomonadota bacterium]
MTSTMIEQYKQEFLQEAKELLESAADGVLKLEADPDNFDLINSVFRAIHTIKGSAGTFELEAVSGFTHHLEGMLDALRDHRIFLTPDMTDAILAGIDHISRMIAAHETGRDVAGDATMEARFRSYYDELKREPEAASPAVSVIPAIAGSTAKPAIRLVLSGSDLDLPPSVTGALKQAAAQGQTVCRIDLLYTSELLENGYDPCIFLRNLKDAVTIYHAVTDAESVPALNDFEPLALYLKPTVYVAAHLSLEELKNLCFDEALLDIRNLVDSAGIGAADSFVTPEAIREFIEGATEMIESAEQAAMVYESKGSPDALKEIFRIVHNIKGDSDFVGFSDLSVFCHAVESMLEKLRAGRLARSSDIVDNILKSIDYIHQCVHALANDQPPPTLPPLYSALKRYETANADPDLDDGLCAAQLLELPENMREVYIEQIRQYRKIFLTTMKSLPMAPNSLDAVGRSLDGVIKASGVVGHIMLQKLAQQAWTILQQNGKKGDSEFEAEFKSCLENLISFIDGLETGPKRLGEILVEDGKIAEKDLEDALSRQKPIGQMLLEEGKITEADLTVALEKQELMEMGRQARPEEPGDTTIRTMRVDERKIEKFSNTVGEMLIARNTYAYLIGRLEQKECDIRGTVKALKDNLHLFSRLSNDIHHGVIELRMIPIRGIFQKFTRVVRDISRKQRKMIELMTDGEDIEIDKKVADVLSDPLVHLIRNSCDHGIETPIERKKAGKAEKGTLLLRASREGSNIMIRIIDDGRGVNRQRLFEKARDSGIPVTSVDDPGLLDLIFMPGLSTAAEITDVSGRGVGMDVVKTTVESVGGTVRVISDPDQGTEITLSIPTAMGIDTVLFVETAGRSYAIPINFIVETVKIPTDRFRRAGSHVIFHYRGEVLTAHYLEELLNGDQRGMWRDNFFADRSPGDVPVVIIKTTRGKHGVVIDRLDKNMEIAIKPVPDVLSELDVVSGVSITGDGRVLLVLNPERML